MNIWHDISKERISKSDFIGVVEIGGGHGVLHDSADRFPRHIGGAHIVERRNIDLFREGQGRLGSAEIGGVGFPLRILAEIHIRRAVEEGVEGALFCHGFRGKVGKRAFDDGDPGEKLFRIVDSVEVALFPDDFRGAVLTRFSTEAPAE